MDSPISLRYPNGRVHETILTTSAELKPGYRFDLYGHHWNAVSLIKRPRTRAGDQGRMLCVTIDSAASRGAASGLAQRQE